MQTGLLSRPNPLALLLLGAVFWSTATPVLATCRGGSANGVREAGEQCDGGDTGPYTCRSYCFTAGGVSCRSDCTIDTATCEGCGNARIDAGEACDGAQLNGYTCAQGGTAACAADCLSIDTRGCFVCGNGRHEGTEQCDAQDLGGATCNAPGETGGTPGCTAACQLDRAPCWRCGNNRIDPGEQCDGTPGCPSTCQLPCGNGTIEGTEECDDGNVVPGDGCHLCGLESSYDGGGAQLRECNVEWGTSGPPVVAATVACSDGAACDVGTAVNECTVRVFHCFNRAEFGSGGVPCAPTNIKRLDLVGASLTGASQLPAADQDLVLSAFSATLTRGGAAVVRTGVRLDATPAMATARICGLFLLRVPKTGARTVALRATDAGGSTDDDSITFQCN